jgi:hypothetical protein
LAFELCLARPPDSFEESRLENYYSSVLESFGKDNDRAHDVAGTFNELQPAKELPELAAWTMICRAILNLDETITQG